MLIGAHAASDAVHDDADLVCGHGVGSKQSPDIGKSTHFTLKRRIALAQSRLLIALNRLYARLAAFTRSKN